MIKMLYAADREALIGWNRTITGDRFCSMKNGPVLSRVYDLMCGKISGPHMTVWESTFNPRDGNRISLRRRDADLGPLSERETLALERAFKKFRHVPAGKLIEFLHRTLPEWKDPGDSSAPIDPREILFNNGLTEEDVAEIEEELDSIHSAKRALQSA